ncbi:AraC family transcriptional regulator [Paenibacillus senegalensis]|uniref:AraC family transcriptional regulator n=1 Tax=Paenibacillus senegalensis TaxID=1465766 RepID=UPI000288C7F0|nr:AraC family transcriptional regulator [Paenibacillus senegalensis]
MVHPLPKVTLAGDFILAPDATVGPRVIKEHELIYFINPRRFVYQLEEEMYSLNQPCVVLQRPGIDHHYWGEGDISLRHQFVHFTPGEMLGHMLPNWSTQSYFPLENNSLIPELFSELLHIVSDKGYGWEERCGALIFAMVSHLLEAGTDTEAHKLPIELQHAIHYIEIHLADPIPVKELSRQANWSHEHFTRMFKRYVGLSPMQYILSRRIERACRLMANKPYHIREISEMSGFQSEQYFSRCFRKLKGMSPSAYRHKIREVRPAETDRLDKAWKGRHPLNTYFVQ